MKEEGEEGEGVDNPAKHWWWWLPLPRKLGGQLPAGCGGLLLGAWGKVGVHVGGEVALGDEA